MDRPCHLEYIAGNYRFLFCFMFFWHGGVLQELYKQGAIHMDHTAKKTAFSTSELMHSASFLHNQSGLSMFQFSLCTGCHVTTVQHCLVCWKHFWSCTQHVTYCLFKPKWDNRYILAVLLFNRRKKVAAFKKMQISQAHILKYGHFQICLPFNAHRLAAYQPGSLHRNMEHNELLELILPHLPLNYCRVGHIQRIFIWEHFNPMRNKN